MNIDRIFRDDFPPDRGTAGPVSLVLYCAHSFQGGHLERQSFRSYVYGLVALRGDTVGAPFAFGNFRYGEAHFSDRHADENRLDQPAHRDRDGSQRRRGKSRSLDIRK